MSYKKTQSMPEDMQVLSELYELQDFKYFDISQHEKLQNMLNKWPLLAEIQTCSKK